MTLEERVQKLEEQLACVVAAVTACQKQLLGISEYARQKEVIEDGE